MNTDQLSLSTLNTYETIYENLKANNATGYGELVVTIIINLLSFSYFLGPKTESMQEKSKEIKKQAGKCVYECRKCKQCLYYMGLAIMSSGEPFIQELCKDLDDKNWQEFKTSCLNVTKDPKTIMKIMVIDKEFIECYTDCDHLPLPSNVSSPELAIKFKDIKHYLGKAHVMKKFRKILHLLPLLQKVKKTILNSIHCIYWCDELQWAIDLATKLEGKKWSNLSYPEQVEIMIYGLLTGKHHGQVHTTYEKFKPLLVYLTNREFYFNEIDLMSFLNKISPKTKPTIISNQILTKVQWSSKIS